MPKAMEHYSTIRYDARKFMEWDDRVILFNDIEVKVKLSKTTDDYVIDAPPAFMEQMRTLYAVHKDGYAGLTLGQFVRKLLGIGL